MTSQSEAALAFKKLHFQDNPLILYNIWDAGSAKAVENSGAKAIATGSWSVAAAHGYADGEKISLDLVLANLQRIIANTTLPVSFDFECGYGKTPELVAKNIAKVIEIGAVGINFEDQIVGGSELYSITEQCERIQAIRDMANKLNVPLFINARTDLFFKAALNEQTDDLIEDIIKRAKAFKDAGADGFFPIGLKNPEHIKAVCEHSPLPVNIVMTELNIARQKELVELGVARLSYSPTPYRTMIEVLKNNAQKIYA